MPDPDVFRLLLAAYALQLGRPETDPWVRQLARAARALGAETGPLETQRHGAARLEFRYGLYSRPVVELWGADTRDRA